MTHLFPPRKHVVLAVVTVVDVTFPSKTQYSTPPFPPPSLIVTSEWSLAPLAIPSICEYREKQWPQCWLISIHDIPVIKDRRVSILNWNQTQPQQALGTARAFSEPRSPLQNFHSRLHSIRLLLQSNLLSSSTSISKSAFSMFSFLCIVWLLVWKRP